MKHIEINIWKACNNKCRFCMSSKFAIEKVEETWWLVDIDIIKKEIDNYSFRWYNSIWYIWWDISIHPHLIDIISYSKSKWFKNINVITNWMIFSDYQKANDLILAWVTRVNISVHSWDYKEEDYITQIQWWLKMKLKAIDNFNVLYEKWLLKSKLSINIVLNWLNYKNILKTCIYFHKFKNIDDIRINFLWNRFFIDENDKEILEISYTDIIPYLKNTLIYSLNHNLRLTFDTIPACIFNKLWFNNIDLIINNFIWENKDYISEVSNMNKNQTFNRKDQKKNELKTKFDTCVSCKYDCSCEWVWKEYVESFWKEEFLPVKLNYDC